MFKPLLTMALLSSSVTMITSASLAQTQPELPGLFDNRLAQDQMSREMAKVMVPMHFYTEALEQGVDRDRIREIVAERLLDMGGRYVATGAALTEALSQTTYYSSNFDVLVSQTIYSDIKTGIQIIATNTSSKAGFASFTVSVNVPMDAGVEVANKNFEKAFSQLRTILPEGHIELDQRYERYFKNAHRSLDIGQLEVDVQIKRESTPQAMEAKMDGVLREFAEMNSKDSLRKLGKDRRSERALESSRNRKATEIDPRESAKRAGRK